MSARSISYSGYSGLHGVAPAPAARAANASPDIQWFALAMIWALHAGIGLLIHSISAFATFHAVATLALGFCFAMFAGRPERIACVAAYIVGSEVLWRMSHAAIFSEIGKYAICLILAIALFRMKVPRLPYRAVLYMALLLPSIITPYFMLDWDAFRQQVSFNLSGPLALTIAVCFFTNVKLSWRQMWEILFFLLAPIVGIASITIFSTYSREVRFSGAANFVTSGGFGPNQVSAALGLGTLILAFYLLYNRSGITKRMLLVGMMLMLAVQSAMTFSRGGLWCAGASFLATALFLVNKREFRRVGIIVIVTILVSTFIIFPLLDGFTGGALKVRFMKSTTTGRDGIAAADLDMWLRAPIFGVGVGISKLEHKAFAAAHTEFTRMLAEHGALGLLALVSMIILACERLLRRDSAQSRPFAAGILVWSLMFMAVNAMRLAAPSFVFGLAFCQILTSRKLAFTEHSREQPQYA